VVVSWDGNMIAKERKHGTKDSIGVPVDQLLRIVKNYLDWQLIAILLPS
jgi:hypothetical protein